MSNLAKGLAPLILVASLAGCVAYGGGYGTNSRYGYDGGYSSDYSYQPDYSLGFNYNQSGHGYGGRNWQSGGRQWYGNSSHDSRGHR